MPGRAFLRRWRASDIKSHQVRIADTSETGQQIISRNTTDRPCSRGKTIHNVTNAATLAETDVREATRRPQMSALCSTIHVALDRHRQCALDCAAMQLESQPWDVGEQESSEVIRQRRCLARRARQGEGASQAPAKRDDAFLWPCVDGCLARTPLPVMN